jgi:hypothetical protein
VQRAGDAVGQRLEAAFEGEPEDRLMRVALGVDANGRLEDVIHRGVGHTAGNPARGHLVQVAFPDLLVVGDHEMLGEARAHLPLDPVVEVLGAGFARLTPVHGLEIALEAVELGFGRQVADAVLERVGDVAMVLPEDPRVAVLLDQVVAAHAVQHPVEDLFVLGEQDVPASMVVGEALDLGRTAEAAGCIRAFEQSHIVAVLLEEAGYGQTGNSGAENRKLHGMLREVGGESPGHASDEKRAQKSTVEKAGWDPRS